MPYLSLVFAWDSLCGLKQNVDSEKLHNFAIYLYYTRNHSLPSKCCHCTCSALYRTVCRSVLFFYELVNCTVLCCNAGSELHYTALYHTALQCTAFHLTVWQSIANHCTPVHRKVLTLGEGKGKEKLFIHGYNFKACGAVWEKITTLTFYCAVRH